MKRPTSNPSAIAKGIYVETRALYKEIAPQLNGAALGYKVLYGPPLDRPPIFFLGWQVGGGAADQRSSELKSWPPVSEYATAYWKLAQELQDIFGVEFLKKCTGTNVNFFRAPNDTTYRATVPANLRERCEAFSRDRAWRLIKAIKPLKIVVIGVGVTTKLNADHQFVYSEEGVKIGNLWGCRAIAVWHLTGTRMTTAQRLTIRQALREFAGMNP